MRKRLRGRFFNCEFRTDNEAKNSFHDSRIHFLLRSPTFSVNRTVATNTDEKDFKGVIPETELILTDSSIDTSDDEDLLQEVSIFQTNLESWLAAAEKRKVKEDERRAREGKKKADGVDGSPAKKEIYDGHKEIQSAG